MTNQTLVKAVVEVLVLVVEMVPEAKGASLVQAQEEALAWGGR